MPPAPRRCGPCRRQGSGAEKMERCRSRRQSKMNDLPADPQRLRSVGIATEASPGTSGEANRPTGNAGPARDGAIELLARSGG